MTREEYWHGRDLSRRMQEEYTKPLTFWDRVTLILMFPVIVLLIILLILVYFIPLVVEGTMLMMSRIRNSFRHDR